MRSFIHSFIFRCHQHFLVVLTMEQENLRPFDLCVLECLAVPSEIIVFPVVSMEKQSRGPSETTTFSWPLILSKKKNNTQLEVNVNIPFEYLSNFERSLHFNKEVHVLIYVFKRDWEDAIYDFTHFISLYNEAKPLVNTNNDIRWNWSSHPALLCYWITHLWLVLTKTLFDNVIGSVWERWAWC